jgi:ATPases involved in chromosome partitioning
MNRIAFLNIKGGAGKTASATTVAHILATEYNKKVLLVDLDPQGNAGSQFNNIDFKDDFLRKMNGEIRVIENSVADLLIDKDIDIKKCISKTEYNNLDVIYSDMRLISVDMAMRSNVTSPQQFRLKHHMKKIDNEYDVCIFDCSSNENLVNTNGLMCTDEVYIPTTTSGNSLEGIPLAFKMIDEIQDYHDSLKIAGVFFTCYTEKKEVTKLLNEIMKQGIEEEYIIPINIRVSTYLEKNSVRRKPLLVLDKAKTSGATKDYIKLVKYILAPNKKIIVEELLKEL